MRIDEFTVSGFGHFFEQDFGPFESPITVFCGPNEAGKTTLLAFLRAALFGFPARGREAHYPPLRGGRHGGTLRLRDDGGRAFEVEFGERSLVVRDGAGQSLDRVELERILGHASRDTFESVFAFGIEELQQLGILDRGEAARHIYAAGMGASRLPAALASIERARNELFKERGHLPEISKKLRELEQVDNAIRACAGDAGRFAALQQERESLDAKIEAARLESERCAAVRGTLDIQRRAWADWWELGLHRERLQALPPTPALPDNALGRLEALESTTRRASDELRAAEQAAERLAAAAAVPAPNQQLLQHRDAVAAIHRQLGDAEHSVRDLRTRAGELRQADTALATEVAALGRGWTAEAVEAFDTSFQVRAALREHEQRLKDSSDRLRDARSTVGQAERGLDAARGALDAAEQRLDAASQTTTLESFEERREGIRVARARLEAANRAAYRAELLEQAVPAGPHPGPRAMHLRTALGLAAALVTAAGGFALGGAALFVGALAAVAIGGSTAWDALRRRADVDSEQGMSGLQAARDEEALAFAALAECAESLGVDHVSQQVLDELEDALGSALQASLVSQRAAQDVESAARDVATAEARLSAAADDVVTHQSANDESRSTWERWLDEKGFPPSLAPAAAGDFITRVEQVARKAAEVRGLRERIEKIRGDIESFRASLAPIAAAAGIPIESNESLIPAAERVIELLDEAEKAAHDHRTAKHRAEEAARVLRDRRAAFASDEQALIALLHAAGVSDADSYRAVAAAAAERQKLLARIADLELSLSRLCGPAERVEALDAELRSTSASQLDQDLADAVRAAEEVSELREALHAERGRVNGEIERLDSSEEASRLHAQRAELVEELRSLARRWSTLTIAQRLLERAREQYQQQRQPAVVANAQEFFTTVTGGRYQRIVAQIGEQALSVHDAERHVKSPDELSRGTREQLYLALRFGLIRQFNEQAARLPVIVDDILVNFDPERAERTARAFVELSRTNQVFVFTCQPATAALFKAASRSTQVIDLSDLRKSPTPRLL